MVWDLDKEQLVKSMPFESGCSVTALVSQHMQTWISVLQIDTI